MATIGTFKKTGSNEFTGEIVTLSVQAKNVRIVPETSAPPARTPPATASMVGRAEIGAAWSKRSNEGRDYLGLKLDDPELQRPDLRQPLRRRGRRRLQPHLVPPQRAPQRRLRPGDAPSGRSGRGLRRRKHRIRSLRPELPSAAPAIARSSVWPEKPRTTIIVVVLACA